VDTDRVHPHDHDDDTVEAHYACLERPYACRHCNAGVAR
jgi:hypothetical protein